MATTADTSVDDDVRRLNGQSERLEAETRKLTAEANKLSAEQYKLSAEQFKLAAEELKLVRDIKLSPWLLLAQGALAAAGLMGAGAAFAKLFLAH